MSSQKPTYEELIKQVGEMKQMLVQNEKQTGCDNTIKEAIFLRSPVAIMIFDEKGDILDANHACEKITGYSRLKIKGINILKLVHPGHHKDLEDFFKQTTPIRNLILSICVYVVAGQKRWYNVRIEPILDKSKKQEGAYVILSDITELKKTEEVNVTLEKQLGRSQKHETFEVFAGGIANDFNNILAPIKGYAQMSLETVPNNTDIRRYQNQILKGTNRAVELVEKILLLSRYKEQKKTPLEIKIIIKQVLKSIKPSLPSNIKIIEYFDEHCGLVTAIADQIYLVVMNILNNAVDAMMDDGGNLKISLTAVKLSPESFPLPGLSPGTYICLSVIDTGIGMDNFILEQVFDPYFTTKEKSIGTGLGLTVVMGIVKKHGGGVEVSSNPGEGTVFKVYLPAIEL